MTKTEIIKYLSTNIGKPKVIELSQALITQGHDLNELIDITFHPDDDIGFRAIWVLEYIALDSPEIFLHYIPYFYSRIKEVKNGGCKRHYAKITEYLTAKNAPDFVKQCIADLDMEPTVEQLFDWIIDPDVKIAVKVFAAEALFNLRYRYDWIAEELYNQLEFLMKDGSPAIQLRGKKLLEKL